MSEKVFNKKYFIEIFSLAIFLIIIPICSHVTYRQNDEGIFYGNVKSFLHGNLALHPLTAPTFYVQGFLAVAFSKVFGFANLPYLTLAVSVAAYYVFCKILKDRLNKDTNSTLLLSLFLLFNPLFVYSSFGFMTENYFLFFFLLSLYLYLGTAKKDFIFANIVAFLTYLTRQLGLVLPLANTIYLFLKKNYKNAAIQLGIFLAILIFHYAIFPKTPEMFEDDFKTSRFTFFRYSFSFIYIIGIYLASLLLPLFSIYILNNFRNTSKKKLAIYSIIIALISVASLLYFKPSLIWHDKFFYLINILQRDGFYTENVHGFKPRFANYETFYSIWDFSAKILAVGALIVLIKKKNNRNLPIIASVIYMALLLISPKIHDRYLLPLFPLAILFLTESINIQGFTKYFMGLFVLLLGFYSYNYNMDYVLTNQYIWNRSEDIVASRLTDAGEIVSTALWNFSNPSVRKSYDYKFTYDPPNSPEYSKNHTLIESRQIRFPLSMWKEINIYLYKLNH